MEASYEAPCGSIHTQNDDFMSEWATRQYVDKYSWKDEDGEPTEVWPDTAYRVVRHVLGTLGYDVDSYEVRALTQLVSDRKFIPGGRYLAMSGRPKHQTNNCFLYRCADSIAGDDGWADLVSKSIKALASGGGIGTVYSDVRPYGSLIKSTGGIGTGPLSPAKMVNEVARHVLSGGHRRAAVWGGLHWWHPDIFDWIASKDWSDEIKALKEKDHEFPAPLDMTNISVILDSEFFLAYHNAQHKQHQWAQNVYWRATEHMLRHGEPGFSVNVGADVNECLRNACTEITSEDDSDVCNLGSINLARIKNQDELAETTRLATLFLLAGTVYSDVPHEEVLATREKNRRLGLGLMGVHEWLIARGYDYSIVPELREWLGLWRDVSDESAERYSTEYDLSCPVKRRAIAPNGTIGIIGETTTSAEPVLFAAYKRRFLDHGTWKHQFVLDPTVERMRVRYGIDPDAIETAYTLALNPEKRIKFQADLQEYVDHGISSTINLEAPITDPAEIRHYGEIFMGYLPKLRGFTCYPNGARSGQPFEACTWFEASRKLGVTYEENREGQCSSGACGI